MVVTRKTPTAPVPPVSSRTASSESQQIPRATKIRTSQTIPDAPEQSSSFVNGGSPTLRGHDPNIRRNQKQSYKKNAGFFGVLKRALILIFVFYSLFICPSDTANEKPVCQALRLYDRLVLEPYIIPPIRNALAHPTIAPHVARIQPHFDYVMITIRTMSARVSPQWEKHVVTQWNRHVVPQWNRHVVPQWKRHVLPHIRRVQNKYAPLWQKHVVPRIQNVQNTYIPLWRYRVLPRIRRAQRKCIPLVHKIKVAVRRLLVLALVQRRQYVDPHVARIWEKVKEHSRGKARSMGDVAPPFTSVISGPALIPTTSINDVDAQSTPAVTLTIISEPSLVLSQNIMDANDDLTSLSVEPLSTSITSITSEPSDAPSTQGNDDVHVEPTSSYVAPSTTSEPSVVPLAPNNEDVDIDLASFYADLGLDVSDDKPDSTVLIAAPPQETETEEERTDRLRLLAEKTAKKRADIMARHLNWEEQLEAQIKEKCKELRKALVSLRKSAVTELKEAADIRAQVEGFVSEAEKFLKGAEVYLKNLTKEKRRDEEKMSLWERVVGKVETKFSEKLRDVETVVNEWYMGIVNREMKAVKDAVVAIRLFAEKAQADLGLDYAWLDDVTYEDWQRYHALVGKSEEFASQASSIQNGSHSSPLINPILPALADLQSEVEDIVVGFETRLRRIKRSGERAFGSGSPESESDTDDKEPEVSILPIPEGSGVQDGAELNIPPVVIGRGKEEVLQAMERAESRVRASQPEFDGSRKDPDVAETQVPFPGVNEAADPADYRMEL